MYIKVIYKDSNEMIINPNCYARLIYDYIRIKADVPDEYEMDICDRDGNLFRIYAPPFNRNGLETLIVRETYYVILLQVESKPGNVKLIPWINAELELHYRLVKALELNKLFINEHHEIYSLSQSRTILSASDSIFSISGAKIRRKKKKKDLKTGKLKKIPSIDRKKKSVVTFF